MPLESLFSNPNPSVPRTRSILSRFTNPIAKHARNITDFEVELPDPYKTYSPGEVVKGNVVLTVAKGFDLTHLVVALHGYAKVFRNLVTPGEGTPETELLVNGKGTSGFEYHGKGLSSLFQDEQVLCGSGFLKRQIYKFGFELEFPTNGLPSTIEVRMESTRQQRCADTAKFERGTISYIISATLTRPTTIAPTSTCHRTVKFRDDIDISPLSAPKSRVITLEPITRRGKVKKLRQSPSIRMQVSNPTRFLARKDTDTSVPSIGRACGVQPPLSPRPSEDTVTTQTSGSSQSLQIVSNPSNTTATAIQTSDTRSTNTSSSSSTITATTEILKQGALPDDVIPIKVLVQHTKAVRGVVIVTLYRQARVDMHPAIPMGRKGKDKVAEYEDIYPKSRTGLGGLYFANGSPSSLFRKDLAQTSTLMVVDPGTLIADVRTSIRVPQEAIPSISNVPGDMISFKYYVEVVLDLCGKLGETRFLPSLTSSGPTFTYASEAKNQLTSEWANNILDTAQIRRTKSVVSLRFSVVVGTRDSGRVFERSQNGAGAPQGEAIHHLEDQDQQDYEYYEEQGYNQWYYDESGQPLSTEYGEQDHEYQPPQTHLIPPPETDEEVDEKTRLRWQEELLLPSQPPEEGEPSNLAQDLVPSAPFIPNIDELVSTEVGPSAVRHAFAPSGMPGISTRSADTIWATGADAGDASAFVPAGLHNEDKQELERRRLMAHASAPPLDEAHEVSSAQPLMPTAPVLNEEENYNAHTLNHVQNGGEHLPQYQR